MNILALTPKQIASIAIASIFILVFAVIYVRILIINKRTRILLGSYAILLIVVFTLYYLGLIMEKPVDLWLIIKFFVLFIIPLILIYILVPDVREVFVNKKIFKVNEKKISMGSAKTKESIVEAVMELARNHTGALITIEKRKSLERFAEKAIHLNSTVTKELLLNIFVPNTPLHDGAVIIRGDLILCAGAYYHLSNNDSFDKTTGSRHRAGLGISEETDSLTIIVSEETGDISLAYEGVLIKITDRDKLLEYLNTFMK